MRRVVIYARLSVTTEESVSIERQVEAARKYAEARGWEVVFVAVDDGVSATKNRPEDRVGWREILESPETFEAVIVWKVDRLARRVLDFLHADEALRQRGAGLVAVEDPIDMTTAQGRAFATMLAVFGEMEAAAISARVTAARRAIVHAGRRAGGRPPFGWMNVENPEGPGMVLAKDPERIWIVTELAGRALAGESLYSLTRWLEEKGIPPRQRSKRKNDGRWHESSVETILRNPALAGLTPYRGDVVRDSDGLPVVDESVAIMGTDARRRLLAVLDERKRPRVRPYRDDALLSGLVRCESCTRPMYRATAGGKWRYYRCQHRDCPQRAGISRPALEEWVEERFLRMVGSWPVQEEIPVKANDSLRLADVEAAIQETLASMADDDADVVALSERLASLKALRSKTRAEVEEVPETEYLWTGETFGEAWEGAEDVREKRALLASGVAAVMVKPSDGGRGLFDEKRVRFIMKDDPEAATLA